MDPILLAVYHKGNRRLLKEWLAARYTVVEAETPEAVSQPFALCIVDAVTLDRCEAHLAAHKERESPLFAPVLLVTQRKDVGLTTRNLWKTVDDLIIAPIEKIELQARVHSLILARRLSQQVQEQTQALLHSSEARYHQLFEASMDAMFVLDAEGRILDVNQVAEKRYGYRHHELLTMRAHELAAPDLRKHTTVQIRQALKTGARFEWWHRRKDGSELPVEISAVPITLEGQRCILAIVRDISERKQAEEQLRQLNIELEQRVLARTAELAEQVAEVEQLNRALTNMLEDLDRSRKRAEAADRVKSAFLAAMSHELRTPLNSIIGFTGVMLQGLVGPLNPEQSKQLGMVQKSARHLLALINDVLDLSKIEAGQLEVAREPFDLRATVERVVQTVAPLAANKGLDLVVEVAPEVGQVVSDQRRVEQVLLNLVNNAIKFTDRGRITVVADRVPAIDNQPSTIRLRVVDTGIGIKREDQSRLFEPFHQLDTGPARQHEGTGLGLSICKRLVNMLGGEIWAESERGQGSTFTFTLPMDDL